MRHRRRRRNPTYPKHVNTTWDLWTYDVWGNKRDGYEVNDRSNIGRDVPLRLKVTVHNVGTVQEFASAYPSDAQIRQLFGLKRFRISTDGDDLNIDVERASDGYPIGEMNNTSHASLSPIRAK